MDLDFRFKLMIIMPALRTGGSERIVVNYANWLVENTKCDVKLVIFENDKTIYTIDDKVNVVSGNITSKNRLLNIFNRIKFLKKMFSEYNPNIVFTVFPIIGLYALLFKNKNCVAISSERANLLRRTKFSRFISKYVAKHSDGFIFQTNRVKNQYSKSAHDKSKVIANAVSNPMIEKVSEKEKKNIITAMGRLTYQKGFDILIRAFAIVLKDYPNYILNIYGDGQDKNSLQKLINELNISDKVFLKGNSNSAISEIAKSKIFVLSSRYEGMPNALMEAMAVGSACISTDCVAGPSEIINNNENGILVPVDDIKAMAKSICELLKNDKLRERISLNATKIVEQYAPNVIFKKYYDYMVEVYFKHKNIRINVFRRLYDRTILTIRHHSSMRFISDKRYIKLMYEMRLHKKLDLDNPQTFNEKLQWLKLYNRNLLYTDMVDKYRVREYIKEKIGEEYLIPLLGVYDKFDDINFDELPNQFVIKCNHDSGGLCICYDKSKFDFNNARLKIEKSLKHNYYYSGREWPYKDVKRKIIIEKYVTNDATNELVDYKFFCFNGIPQVVLVCSERFSSSNMCKTFFDIDWKLLPLVENKHRVSPNMPKPISYDKMIKFSQKLAEGIPFVRIDFYEVNNKTYFGEITFFPNSGHEKFDPENYDMIFGNLIDLSLVRNNKNEKKTGF